MYLTKAFQQTWQALRKHPYLFVLLLLLQLLLAGSLFYTIFTYQTRLLEDATALLESQPEQLSESASPQASTQALLQLYQHYKNLLHNGLLLLSWLGGIMVVGEGLLWWVSHYLLGEAINKGRIIVKHIMRYLMSVFVLVLPGIVGSYYSLKMLIIKQMPELLGSTLRDMGIVFLVSSYLLLVALALLPTTSWKEFVHKWWRTAISLHKTIPVLLINVITMGGILALLLWKMWFWLIIPLLVLIPLARLFWISSVQEISRKEFRVVGAHEDS